jgi:hypothetical protein
MNRWYATIRVGGGGGGATAMKALILVCLAYWLLLLYVCMELCPVGDSSQSPGEIEAMSQRPNGMAAYLSQLPNNNDFATMLDDDGEYSDGVVLNL